MIFIQYDVFRNTSPISTSLYCYPHSLMYSIIYMWPKESLCPQMSFRGGPSTGAWLTYQDPILERLSFPFPAAISYLKFLRLGWGFLPTFFFPIHFLREISLISILTS